MRRGDRLLFDELHHVLHEGLDLVLDDGHLGRKAVVLLRPWCYIDATLGEECKSSLLAEESKGGGRYGTHVRHNCLTSVPSCVNMNSLMLGSS